MINTVTVNVSATLIPTTREGFGQIAILSSYANWVGGLGHTYLSETDMVTDFPSALLPERIWARQIFAQSPRPESVKVFRAPSKATQAYNLSAITAGSKPLTKYEVRVTCATAAEVIVSFTSDASPSDAEWAAGMVIALNAVPGKNYTAAGAASPVTITGNAPGDWFSIEVLDVLTQSCVETTADPGVANDLAAMFLEDSDVYFIAPMYGSQPYLNGVASWVDANSRMCIAATSVTPAISAGAGGGDAMDSNKTNGRKRTGVMYHRAPAAAAAAAWEGRVSALDPGSVNFMHKTLTGVPRYGLNATQVANIRAKNGNGYDINNSGRWITFDGKAGDGSFLDQTRAIDYTVFELRRRLGDLLAQEDIVLYTQEGFALVRATLVAGMDHIVEKKIASPDVPYVIKLPDLKTIDAATKATRILNAADVTFTGASALNGIVVNLRQI